jgi:hypothetical protein
MWSRPDLAGSMVSAVSAGRPCRVGSGRCVAVAVLAADALVAAGAERPAPVLGRGPVAGEEHAADVGEHPGVVEDPVELVDGGGPEGVADLGTVEGDADGAEIVAGVPVHRTVVGEVAEVEPLDLPPAGGVEQLGDLGRFGDHEGHAPDGDRGGPTLPRRRHRDPATAEPRGNVTGQLIPLRVPPAAMAAALDEVWAAGDAALPLPTDAPEAEVARIEAALRPASVPSPRGPHWSSPPPGRPGTRRGCCSATRPCAPRPRRAAPGWAACQGTAGCSRCRSTTWRGCRCWRARGRSGPKRCCLRTPASRPSRRRTRTTCRSCPPSSRGCWTPARTCPGSGPSCSAARGHRRPCSVAP